MPRLSSLMLCLFVTIAAAGCSGGGSAIATFTVGGTVTGLSGTGLVLQNNGKDDLTVKAAGAFTFPTALANGTTYAVSVATQPTGQACTVTGGADGRGGGTVSGANVTNVTVTCVDTHAQVGGTVQWLAAAQTVVLQNNGGDTLTVTASGSFTFPTALANGATYSVTVASQPAGQTCRVTGGDDGSGGGKVVNGVSVANILVNCGYPRYAYVVNQGDNSVSTYVIDPGNGRLKWIGKAATGTSPRAVTIDPRSRYVYVVNYYDGNAAGSVSEYTIGADGSLAPITGNPSVGAGRGPVSITVDPSGSYAYVANKTDGTISQYTIASDGSLSAIISATANPTVAAGALPASVTVDPSGKYAYAANSGDNTVSQYTIGADGSLTPMATSTVVTGTGPYAVTVDPSGHYAYVVNHNNGGPGSVSEYTVGADGSLTLMTGASVPAGTAPVALTVDPATKYAYAANQGDNTVSQYVISAGGSLAPMTPPAVAGGAGPAAVTVDSTGKYVYAVNASGGNVSAYAIGTGGGLTALVPAAIAAPANPQGIVMTQGTAAVQAIPAHAYVANSGDNSVSQYTTGAGGTLTTLGNPVTGTTNPVSIAVDPSGRYAYVLSGGGTVSQYTVGTDGSLSPMTPATVAAGASPVCIAVDPAGRYAYVTNGTDGTVSQYTVGSDGTLSAMAPATVAAGANPVCIAVDPSGRYAYVANSGGTVSQYTIGSGGGLVAMSPATVTAGTNPFAVTTDPSGRYAYVTNGDGTVSQYLIGAAGSLTAMTPATAPADTNPVSIAVDPSGRFAYVANVSSSDVSQYTIASNGGLIPMVGTPTVAMPSGSSLPLSLAVDPSGKFVYVVNNNNGGTGTVAQYAIGPGGALTALSPATVAAGTSSWFTTTTGTWK